MREGQLELVVFAVDLDEFAQHDCGEVEALADQLLGRDHLDADGGGRRPIACVHLNNQLIAITTSPHQLLLLLLLQPLQLLALPLEQPLRLALHHPQTVLRHHLLVLLQLLLGP